MLGTGTFLADRYEILEQIGTGGMSDVYKAKCHKLNRYVAIKVLKREFSEDKTFVSKFRAEAQSAAGLTHPNIVNVYDVGDENGIYYIVMELVEGITLKRYIEKRGTIPYKEAVSIAIQVAKGMEAAHNHHIIHRDIKPQNIIISKDGKVKVTDFGIAKAASSSTINSSAAMGSVHYISPEQARGGYSDEKSDIYSFGITLFEMITGTVPFDGDTTISVAVQHINDDIPAPSSIVEGVPISIDKIILKCAQKKTERRYQNASELIADLKKSLVMPDEDFVSMEPAYAKAESVQPQELKVEEVDVEDVAKRTVRPVAPKSDDIDRRVEDKIDRELDDISLDDEEREKPRGRRAKDKAKRVREQEEELLEDDDDLDDYDDYDDDDYSNDKLDKAIMYIGIGIVTLIVIVTVAVAVKLFTGGGLSATSDTEGTTASAVKSTTASAEDGKVTVPSLVGKTEDEAKEALNALSLGYKAVKQASSTIPEGKIISQGTTAGTKVNKNTTITLSISSGPDTVEVPNVVGIDQVEAANAIESAGFTVNVKKSYSDTIEAGKVISQSPSGASTANPGTSVTITVSEGKEEAKSATVPNVVGLSEEDAVAKLKELGIESTVSYQTSANNVKDGYVFGQSVKAGEKVTVGSTITISVKKASATTSSSTKATTKAAETATTTKSANN
jgi:serine/threonine-protein kinase